jgi:hypothetical protein
MNEPLIQNGPDWVVGEMPPGYQTRVLEIRRLIADLEEMSRYARLLWQVGPELASVVRDAFAALKFEAAPVNGPPVEHVAVRLDRHERLLLIPSATPTVLDKKSPELAHVFKLLQEVAGEDDRVVLVTNVDSDKRPADRPAALAPDALSLLVRLGAVHLPGAALFNLWRLSLHDLESARTQATRLHGDEPGTFEVPTSVLRLSEMKL